MKRRSRDESPSYLGLLFCSYATCSFGDVARLALKAQRSSLAYNSYFRFLYIFSQEYSIGFRNWIYYNLQISNLSFLFFEYGRLYKTEWIATRNRRSSRRHPSPTAQRRWRTWFLHKESLLHTICQPANAWIRRIYLRAASDIADTAYSHWNGSTAATAESLSSKGTTDWGLEKIRLMA